MNRTRSDHRPQISNKQEKIKAAKKLIAQGACNQN